jgi:arsenate reductase
MIQVLHNPRCGKSRNCLLFLANNGIKHEVINYIEKPLSEAELKELIKKLAIKPIALVRQKEAIWTENFKNKKLTDSAIIKALAKHPILIERPIVIDANKAIIGRDLDKLKDFL